jgi:DNA invertase Pin-like site-specific DNA recombinase
MQNVQAEELERIRRAYHIEHKSIRAIAREMKHSRSTVAKAVAEQTSPEDVKKPLQLTLPRQT